MLQHEADVATLQMAQAFQAEAVFLRAPGVMRSAALRDAALADPHIQKAMRLLDEVDIVFVGLGPADFHGPLEENDNFFTAEQLAEVRKAGAVGQLHQRFIDAQGEPVKTPLDDLVIGISLDQLRGAGRRDRGGGRCGKASGAGRGTRGRMDRRSGHRCRQRQPPAGRRPARHRQQVKGKS